MANLKRLSIPISDKLRGIVWVEYEIIENLDAFGEVIGIVELKIMAEKN